MGHSGRLILPESARTPKELLGKLFTPLQVNHIIANTAFKLGGAMGMVLIATGMDNVHATKLVNEALRRCFPEPPTPQIKIEDSARPGAGQSPEAPATAADGPQQEKETAPNGNPAG